MDGTRAGGLALLALVLTGVPAGAATPPGVEYRDDRVTVHAEQVPRADVLAAIARATGAELRGQVIDAGDLTIVFDAVPLGDALHRVLGTQSFTVTYGEGARVRVRLVMGMAVKSLL